MKRQGLNSGLGGNRSMESPRLVRMICALGIVGIAVAAPAVARAQRSGAPDTTRRAAVGQTTDTTRATKGPRPPNQTDLMAVRRAASKNAAGGSAASAAPTAPPQAPVKVKPRVD